MEHALNGFEVPAVPAGTDIDLDRPVPGEVTRAVGPTPDILIIRQDFGDGRLQAVLLPVTPKAQGPIAKPMHGKIILASWLQLGGCYGVSRLGPFKGVGQVGQLDGIWVKVEQVDLAANFITVSNSAGARWTMRAGDAFAQGLAEAGWQEHAIVRRTACAA